MMQGDSYGLAIEIKNAADAVVTTEDITDVEITIGHLRKTYKDGGVKFEAGMWIFPLTQEETFKFPSMRVKGQVRVVFKSGVVEGASLGFVHVDESLSKEVL